MVALSSSSASARIRQILRTTTKHFSLPVPEIQLRLDRGEFIDPLPLRWRDTPRQVAHAGSDVCIGSALRSLAN